MNVMFACLDTLHGMRNYSSYIQRYSDVDPSGFYSILYAECKKYPYHRSINVCLSCDNAISWYKYIYMIFEDKEDTHSSNS